jgi:hypothetical protein
MKYLKPSRLRNAFLKVVAFVATVALKVVAPIVAEEVFELRGKIFASRNPDQSQKYISLSLSLCIQSIVIIRDRRTKI